MTLFKQAEEISKAIAEWSEQGRTTEQLFAVSNFMSGRGLKMSKNLVSLGEGQGIERARHLIHTHMNDVEDAEVSFDASVDITEIPDELRAELTGMKKGWKAGLSEILEELK